MLFITEYLPKLNDNYCFLISHKEIAFDLGFSSPSALNKFVRAKLKETPTDLQNELAQIYNA
jgi:AraC family transcriptional activator of pobA